MFDWLGDIIDGVLGAADKAVDGTLNAADAAINGVTGAADNLINGTVNTASSIIDTTVKVGLPVVKTAGLMAIGNIFSPALGAIPGSVGEAAKLYDAADTLHSSITALPDTLNQIKQNFDEDE
jgi:hypothetical protein